MYAQELGIERPVSGVSVQRADVAYLSAGLDRNGYDKSKCEDVFDLYIQCKKREVSSKADQQFTRHALTSEVLYRLPLMQLQFANPDGDVMQTETRLERRQEKAAK